MLGSERFIWASDFPHSDARYPGVVDELREHTADMEDDAKANLYGANALRMYGLA
jgi:predicted TIM-barrel fold metal-dependent hydrolase